MSQHMEAVINHLIHFVSITKELTTTVARLARHGRLAEQAQDNNHKKYSLYLVRLDLSPRGTGSIEVVARLDG